MPQALGEKLMIKTFEEARLLIRELKICTIFESSKTELPSLWEHIDLPEKQKGEEGWGQKVSAAWDWKNRLPAEFPNEIFYGKIKGGFAVLMTMNYLRDFHFAWSYRSIDELNPLAAFILRRFGSSLGKLPTFEKRRLRSTAVRKASLILR